MTHRWLRDVAAGFRPWAAGFAGLALLAAAAQAEVTITGGSVAKVKSGKKTTVVGTFSGTFDDGDVSFAPGGFVSIQIGTAGQRMAAEVFRYDAKRDRYTFKSKAKNAIVQSAVFDMDDRTFTVKVRSFDARDYRTPIHAGVNAPTVWSFEIPVDIAKKKTRVGTVRGETQGAPAGQQTFTGSGGRFSAGGVTVDAPSGAFRAPGDVVVAPTALPGGLPPGVGRCGQPFDVRVGPQEGGDRPILETPLVVTLPYDTGDAAGGVPAILHFDETGQRYDPATLLSVDPVGGTMTVEARSFSVFLPVVFDDSVLPSDWDVTGFTDAKRWSIPNFGRFLSPNGNCLGMSSWCVWFFENEPGRNLSATYSGTAAQIVATRAHAAQSQYWAIKQHQYEQTLGTDATGLLMKAFLAAFDRPLILTMFAPSAGHACVLYGYDEDGIRFYDVNEPGADQFVAFDGSAFGTYGAYDRFGFVALPSIGRNQDFRTLYEEAADGFRGDQVHITSPDGVTTLSSRFHTVTGTVDVPEWNSLWVFANGEPYTGSIGSGSFSVQVPLVAGENTITVLAGTDVSNQSSWAPGSGVNTVVAQNDVPLSELLVSLEWQQNQTDVDLYVTEPGGETSWYSHRTTASGGTLDRDDTDGYGPEHYTTVTPLTGLYDVRVHYYSNRGTGLPATGRVTVVLKEGLPGQVSRTFNFTIGTANSSNSSPGGVGPDWFDVALVDIESGVVNPKASGHSRPVADFPGPAPSKDD